MGIMDFTRLSINSAFILRLLNLIITSHISCNATTLHTVSAEYIYYAPPTMNIIEAKHIALERAKIKAIENEFGSIVSQINSSVVANVNGKSEARFFSLGSSDVKGEWIETIGEPKYGEITYVDNMLIIPCFVKGKARELQSNTTDFIAPPPPEWSG